MSYTVKRVIVRQIKHDELVKEIEKNPRLDEVRILEVLPILPFTRQRFIKPSKKKAGIEHRESDLAMDHQLLGTTNLRCVPTSRVLAKDE